MDKKDCTFAIKMPSRLHEAYTVMSDQEREQARDKMIQALAEHIDEAGRDQRIKELIGA